MSMKGVSTLLFDARQSMASSFAAITKGLAGAISITLPWSPSVNHTWRQAGGRLILDKRVEAFRKKVAGKVNFLRAKKTIPSRAIESDCMVMIEYMPPDKRRRDIDNGCKAVFDALTHAGVWKDDSQVKLLLSFFGRTVKGGAVNVLIQPLEV
jgi:crossover junction endodeoxyribonuclease RusA